MDSNQQALSIVISILNDRGAPRAADTTTQHNQPSVSRTEDRNMQHLHNAASGAEPALNHYCQHGEINAGLLSSEHDQTVIPHPGDSTRHTQRVPCPSSSERIDGDTEYDGVDEDEDSDGGEEDKKNDVDDDCLRADRIEKSDAKMPMPEADSRMNFPTPEVRRGAMRYLEQDRIDIKMLAGSFSAAEVMLATRNIQARLQSGSKREGWEIIEDGLKHMVGRGIKRTKRGGYAIANESSGKMYVLPCVVKQPPPKRTKASYMLADKGLDFLPTANPENYVPLSLVADERSSKDSFEIPVVMKCSGGRAHTIKTYSDNSNVAPDANDFWSMPAEGIKKYRPLSTDKTFGTQILKDVNHCHLELADHLFPNLLTRAGQLRYTEATATDGRIARKHYKESLKAIH